MNWKPFFFLNLFVVFFYSCNENPIYSVKHKRLLIASDFLRPKDSVMFNNFSKTKQIQVKIVQMEIDSLISYCLDKGHNNNIDLIVLKSIYSLNKTSKSQLLNPIFEVDNWIKTDFISPKNDWVVIGIDPYVIGGLSVQRGFQYNELSFGQKWENKLSENDFAVFQSSVMHQFGRKNSNKSKKWLKKIEEQSDLSSKDSTQKNTYFLTKLSAIKDTNKRYVYPSQNQKFGAYYDGIGMGIIKHSSKYTECSQFIQYYLNIVHNQKLCNLLNVLPIQNPQNHSPYAYQNDYPILFRGTPREIGKQLTMGN